MAARRILASVVVTLAVAGMGRAQTYELTESPKPGDCFKIHLTMTLTGELRFSRDGKPFPVKITAEAAHDFPERVLAAADGLPQKTARVYETAKATITTGSDRMEKTLRPERRLLVAQQNKGQLLVYCPGGPLTREEVELTSEHFDTLSVVGLLPNRAVKVDETWKVGNGVAQTLCSFEGLAAQDFTCKLVEVKDNLARVSVEGTATGIDLGAFVKLTIQASYQYDLNARRLTALEWKQRDERGQGPASPASTVETTSQLRREAIEQPASLSDVALISVPDGLDVPENLTQLVYHHDQKTPFDLTYGREWQPVGKTNDHVVFRLMERGDFVAQLTLTPWEKARDGKHLTPEAFRDAMAKTPGWEQGDVVQQGEIPAEGGRWIYRIAAAGLMDGLKVVQNFYLVASPTGEQVVVVFTMTPGQVEKLGSRDLNIVRALEVGKK